MAQDFQKCIPGFTVANAAEAIEWYTRALNATVQSKHTKEEKVLHAYLKLSNGAGFFVNDDFPEMSDGKSQLLEDSSNRFTVTHLNVPISDLQGAWDQVVSNGATVHMELAKQFWGQTYGTFQDPFGHAWSMGEPHHDKPAEEEATQTTAAVGQKRRLETGSDEPPKKRARLTASEVGCAHGAHEFRNVDKVWRGLFMEFNCGAKETGAECTFAEAAKSGLGTVWMAIKEAGFHDQIGPVLAFCPEDPQVREPARYAPGMLLPEGIDVEAIASTNEKFVVREVPAGKWFVFVHIGSYMKLGPSWAAAKEEAGKHGRLIMQLAHERYVNDPSCVAEDELISEIWLKLE